MDDASFLPLHDYQSTKASKTSVCSDAEYLLFCQFIYSVKSGDAEESIKIYNEISRSFPNDNLTNSLFGQLITWNRFKIIVKFIILDLLPIMVDITLKPEPLLLFFEGKFWAYLFICVVFVILLDTIVPLCGLLMRSQIWIFVIIYLYFDFVMLLCHLNHEYKLTLK